ncbi:MAG: hypothetical protein J7J21_05855 [Methanomicrobia archaeon]|nr:hypothetical protein [Methanomicrobia archaeon]
MLKRYLAIDLRGYPNEMYEEVYTPERITSPEEGEAIEICLDDLSEIKRILRELGKTKLIFVRGGDLKLNRGIVQEKRVSVLSDPYPIDDVTARKASENKIAFEINVEEIIRRRGYARSRLIENLKNTIRVSKKNHAPIVITSGSANEFTLKSPRTLVAFGKILGMEYYEAKSAIYNIPKMILQKGENEIKK